MKFYLILIAAVIALTGAWMMYIYITDSYVTVFQHNVPLSHSLRSAVRNLPAMARAPWESLWQSSSAHVNTTDFYPLPLSVIQRVKTFVFFIGIARSGHSIVATLLDSHPHIVISNELDVFNKVRAVNATKSSLFNRIWEASHRKSRSGLLHKTGKGYSLAIDGLYQGTYQSYIDVIGDKHGGETIRRFLTDVKVFQNRLNKLRRLVNSPIKVIHVVRNPYDNIATLVIYRHLGERRSDVAMLKNSSDTISASPTLMDKVIHQYFSFYQGSKMMKQQFNLDTMDMHGRDLIADPKLTITKMCDFLQVSCSRDFVDTVSGKIFTTESKTRYKLIWTDEQISKVKENILKFDSLKQYLNFDS